MTLPNDRPFSESGLAAAVTPGTEMVDNLAFAVRNASIVYQSYTLTQQIGPELPVEDSVPSGSESALSNPQSRAPRPDYPAVGTTD